MPTECKSVPKSRANDSRYVVSVSATQLKMSRSRDSVKDTSYQTMAPNFIN